jgi:hypothetical protein
VIKKYRTGRRGKTETILKEWWVVSGEWWVVSKEWCVLLSHRSLCLMRMWRQEDVMIWWGVSEIKFYLNAFW